MPRYFFHVYNGTAHLDEKGSEHPGLDEALQEATETTGEIIRGGGIKSWQASGWHMEVADAAGEVMLRLHFSRKDPGGKTP
jgi:hypothetical protein